MAAIVDTEKRGRGRPPTNATGIHVKLPPDQLAALDAFIESSGGGLSRPEALRRLLSAVSTIPGAGDHAPEVADQVAIVEQGRRAAAGYARAKGRLDEAAAIEAGEADASPLVQTMMWFQLP